MVFTTSFYWGLIRRCPVGFWYRCLLLFSKLGLIRGFTTGSLWSLILVFTTSFPLGSNTGGPVGFDNGVYYKFLLGSNTGVPCGVCYWCFLQVFQWGLIRGFTTGSLWGLILFLLQVSQWSLIRVLSTSFQIGSNTGVHYGLPLGFDTRVHYKFSIRV